VPAASHRIDCEASRSAVIAERLPTAPGDPAAPAVATEAQAATGATRGRKRPASPPCCVTGAAPAPQPRRAVPPVRSRRRWHGRRRRERPPRPFPSPLPSSSQSPPLRSILFPPPSQSFSPRVATVSAAANGLAAAAHHPLALSTAPVNSLDEPPCVPPAASSPPAAALPIAAAGVVMLETAARVAREALDVNMASARTSQAGRGGAPSTALGSGTGSSDSAGASAASNVAVPESASASRLAEAAVAL